MGNKLWKKFGQLTGKCYVSMVGMSEKESDNMQAAAACIYAEIAMGKTDEAKQLAETYISKDTECTDENDILFVAAEKLYEKVNDKQALKWVRRAEKTYEDRLAAALFIIGYGQRDCERR